MQTKKHQTISSMYLLPMKYTLILVIALVLFNVINIVLVNIKRLKKKIKNTISVFIIIAIILMLFVSFYMWRTISVFNNNGASKYKTENYSVIVLNESDYKKISDIKGETVGFFSNSTGSKEANEELSKKVDVEFEAYEKSDSLIDDLLESQIEVIVVEDSIKNILEEEFTDFN